MANLVCIYSCLLLVVTCFDSTNGSPLRTSAGLIEEKCVQCSSLSKALLENITQLLQNTSLFYGFNCWIDSRMMEVHNRTQTVRACAPFLTESSSCSQSETPWNLTFNKSDCVRNIIKDLAHYATVLQHYLQEPARVGVEDMPQLKQTLQVIQSLMKNCAPAQPIQTSEETTPHTWKETFDNRQRMCKLMKGFHVRAITIARAIGYMSSDYRRH